MNNLQKNIQDAVLKRVEGGSVHMRSRAYFVVRAAATAAVALLALVVSSFVLSFILFSIHEGGEQFLLGAGERGITTFLSLFPWLTLAFDIAIILLLEWLLQGLKLGYRFSLVTVFVAVFAASTALALLINLTPVQPALLERAEGDDLPVFGDLYKGVYYSHEDQGVFKGEVVSINGRTSIGIVCNDRDSDRDEGRFTVVLPTRTTASFAVGDHVYVFGEASSTTRIIDAYRVEKLTPRPQVK